FLYLSGQDGLHLKWTSVGQQSLSPIAKFVILFFKTLLQQHVKKRRGYGNTSNSRYDNGRRPPGNLLGKQANQSSLCPQSSSKG
uniref:Uncharacterized protein n=1 Tax=Theropithecus gelada TaxID=9565 RepID=A0A8D2JWG5_THEGE